MTNAAKNSLHSRSGGLATQSSAGTTSSMTMASCEIGWTSYCKARRLEWRQPLLTVLVCSGIRCSRMIAFRRSFACEQSALGGFGSEAWNRSSSAMASLSWQRARRHCACRMYAFNVMVWDTEGEVSSSTALQSSAASRYLSVEF